MSKRVAQMGATTNQLSTYVGLAKQLVVNRDTWRVHVLDGATAGGYALARLSDIPSAPDLSVYLTKTDASSTYLGKNSKAVSAGSADKATADASGNTITTTYATKDELSSGLAGKQAAGSYLTTTDASTTYLTKTDASSTYLGKTANAVSATKATQDASGNVITETYLTKSSAATTYLGINAKAASASTADSATSATNATNATNATKATQDGNGNVITSTYATQTTANAKIAKSGDRGSLAGYETLTSTDSAVTISDGSPDDQAVTGAVAVTVSNGTAGKVWTKTVGITNESATISLGSSWYWVGGKVPTVAANSVLVLKWYGTFGVANLVLTA